MCERLRIDVSCAHPLQSVITNGGRRFQTGFHVTRFNPAALVRRCRPDTCETIRLQFHRHAERVGALRILLLRATQLAFRAQQILRRGRRWIGIEQSPEYAENSRLRFQESPRVGSEKGSMTLGL